MTDPIKPTVLSQEDWEKQFPVVMVECPYCGGKGFETCPRCGNGEIDCSECNGKGEIKKDLGYYKAVQTEQEKHAKWIKMMGIPNE